MAKPYYERSGITIYHGDCRELLADISSNSISCCVTSPPYWGLRDYGVEGQIGLEKTPEEYVERMVLLFREVRRTLRDDGTLWLNLGDSYNAYNGNRGPAAGLNKNYHEALPNFPHGHGLTDKNLKPKDLIGIPWMVAFALRADGWYLRQDNVWGKPNGMPESVEDRTTRSHEYVFLLSKREKYFYNAEAIRTAPKPSTETRLNQDLENQIGSLRANGGEKTNGPMKAVHSQSDGANLRDVWWISPAQYSQAHFAVMPEKLAAICVAAGCPDNGTVLDPFFGAGTTGAVCQSQHLWCVGIELNRSYCEIAARRLSQSVLNFGGVA